MAQKTKKIILMDFGYKAGIKESLEDLGCAVTVLGGESNYPEILLQSPDGIVLSNGPGDPVDYKKSISNLKYLLKQSIPIFGICLGHQLLALASGGKTYKLPFGHRGNNHPVLNLETKQAFITSHNHGYSVSKESIKNNFNFWFMNLLDNTVEGMKHKNKFVWSVQFHPEAKPGTLDTKQIFAEFISQI